MLQNRQRYLFIRILEACNANCFMCGFALSRDDYRFSLTEFERLLPQAVAAGVRFIRFTGGEPLLHKEIVPLVSAGAVAGMKMSIITNGAFLPRMIDALADAGLEQIIVSIDGSSARSHDQYRGTPGLFDRCLTGLRRARAGGLRCRVNTVVGPYNFEEAPALQRLLTDTGVEQWELSAVKLERPIVYSDPARVVRVCEPVYAADRHTTLVPSGKRFYGDTEDERRRFFDTGVTPRPSAPFCNLVGDVIYIDAKAGRGFGCSLLPHRDDAESGGGVQMRLGAGWTLDSPAFREHVRHFRAVGPNQCRGCSTTAAGYSDAAATAAALQPWSF
jgi:cytosylglucuronate decarboxylase